MENLTVQITQEQIGKALEISLAKALTDSYDSPIRKCIESAIKDKEGLIKKVVDEIITEAIANPSFKTKLADIVIAQMVNAAIKK